MAREIIGDKDGVVLKKLSSPKKNTLLDANFRMSNLDDDVSSLNSGPDVSEKKGLAQSVKAESSAARARKNVGNEGPDANGKVDWSKSPDCVDYINQSHEGSGNSNDEEGYLATANRCVNSFNKLFGRKDGEGVHKAAKVTAEEIVEALKAHYDPGAPVTKKAASPTKEPVDDGSQPHQDEPKQQELPKTEMYFPLGQTTLDLAVDKVPLSGSHFEICKVLNCKHICVMQRANGQLAQNGLFHAACANSSKAGIEKSTCPQEQPLNPKELFLFQMFLHQFNGDALQAKKLFFLSRALQK